MHLFSQLWQKLKIGGWLSRLAWAKSKTPSSKKNKNRAKKGLEL
jgi:hypothetical protein